MSSELLLLIRKYKVLALGDGEGMATRSNLKQGSSLNFDFFSKR